MGHSYSSAQRKIYSIGCLYYEKRKSQFNNLSFHQKKLEKKRNKPKANNRTEIIKIRMEIN